MILIRLNVAVCSNRRLVVHAAACFLLTSGIITAIEKQPDRSTARACSRDMATRSGQKIANLRIPRRGPIVAKIRGLAKIAMVAKIAHGTIGLARLILIFNLFTKPKTTLVP